MINFSKQLILADIVYKYPKLILVLERLGIYAGYGELTIEEIARDHNLSSEVVLLLFELQINPGTSSHVELKNGDIRTIINYLLVSHQYFTTEFYPKVSENIDRMADQSEDDSIQLVRKFFADYCKEAEDHFEYENSIAFPYVLALLDNKQGVPGELSKEYSVDNYRDNHDNIEEKLNDLKQLLIKYLPCEGEYKIRRDLILMIDQLESDLLTHAKLENDILVPMVRKLESNVK